MRWLRPNLMRLCRNVCVGPQADQASAAVDREIGVTNRERPETRLIFLLRYSAALDGSSFWPEQRLSAPPQAPCWGPHRRPLATEPHALQFCRGYRA